MKQLLLDDCQQLLDRRHHPLELCADCGSPIIEEPHSCDADRVTRALLAATWSHWVGTKKPWARAKGYGVT